MLKQTKEFLLFYLSPFVFWVALIYYSSSQSFEDQTVEPLLAGGNLTWISDWFSWVSFYYGDTLVSLETRTTAEFAEFFIRKGAHLAVFGILAILAFRLVYVVYRSNKTAVISSLSFVLLYASVDEFRQSLHPGRSGMVEDVILNVVGGIIALPIFIWAKKRWRC
ncbi:VanZ family protein [Salipaludibacillus daqingensis]|uniref:VanZ family protein n=1 Tax=Salipaludibacillus daqingensis TaxID=3041001 RepID=UPI002474B146|nr:VanZ family protein [Salipaludibacillus daqingensis]